MRDIKKDIVAKANDVGELEGDVCLVRDPQVVHKCLQDRDPVKPFSLVVNERQHCDLQVTDSLIPHSTRSDSVR